MPFGLMDCCRGPFSMAFALMALSRCPFWLRTRTLSKELLHFVRWSSERLNGPVWWSVLCVEVFRLRSYGRNSASSRCACFFSAGFRARTSKIRISGPVSSIRLKLGQWLRLNQDYRIAAWMGSVGPILMEKRSVELVRCFTMRRGKLRRCQNTLFSSSNCTSFCVYYKD